MPKFRNPENHKNEKQEKSKKSEMTKKTISLNSGKHEIAKMPISKNAQKWKSLNS